MAEESQRCVEAEIKTEATSSGHRKVRLIFVAAAFLFANSSARRSKLLFVLFRLHGVWIIQRDVNRSLVRVAIIGRKLIVSNKSD